MGTKAQSIIEVDIEELIIDLNKALADEWLAYYQYWVGSKVVFGPLRSAVVAELIQHATDELRHAGMLADRIVQLGGTPLLSPESWYTMTNCGYDAPSDPRVNTVLDQNIKGEQCAIAVYNKLLKKLEGKDVVTYNMVLSILTDEIEHEEDLQAIQKDIESIG